MDELEKIHRSESTRPFSYTYSSEMSTHNLRFGVKKGHSNILCTTVLKDVALQYTQHGLQVFCHLVDASKDFD